MAMGAMLPTVPDLHGGAIARLGCARHGIAVSMK
jgi:hypothetical protein